MLGQARAVQRHTPLVRDDEDRLTGRIIELAAVDGRYGTPRIGALLKDEGWRVNHKCLSIDVDRKQNSDDVLERLACLMVTRGGGVCLNT